MNCSGNADRLGDWAFESFRVYEYDAKDSPSRYPRDRLWLPPSGVGISHGILAGYWYERVGTRRSLDCQIPFSWINSMTLPHIAASTEVVQAVQSCSGGRCPSNLDWFDAEAVR